MKIKEFAFIGYPVTNIERSRSFYEKILGLAPEMVHQLNSGQWWIEYDINGATLAISNTWEPSAQSGPTLALEVDDIDEWLKSLKSQNINFFMEMEESPVCRFAGILDPDGNPLMLHQRKEDCC